jgi:hypothetical protein
MALSQDEQRILAEIERRMVTDDPSLASSLTTFRRPRPSKVFRSPRARIMGSLFTVLLVAMVSLTVYAMIPFRAQMSRQTPPAGSTMPATTAISEASSQSAAAQQHTQPTSASPASSGASSTALADQSQQAKATVSASLLLPASGRP